MPVKRRAKSDTFTLTPSMGFDDAKRNLRQLLIQLNEEGGEVTICKTEDKPQFIIYPHEQADHKGDDLSEAQRVSVAQFVSKSTSWQTILRYEGQPVVLEVNSVPKAVIKVHPDWRSETIERARKRFQTSQRDEILASMSAKLDEVLGLLKGEAESN